MNKTELLDWLQEQNRDWEALLDRIGPERMELPGVNGDWSMKDLIAHLTGWQPRLISHIRAAQRGEPTPPPPWPADLQTEDAVNAWIYAANRDRSLQEVREEARHVFQQLLDVIAALPEDVRIEPEWHLVWVGGQRFPAGEFFDHYRDDHAPDVRAWLSRMERL